MHYEYSLSLKVQIVQLFAYCILIDQVLCGESGGAALRLLRFGLKAESDRIPAMRHWTSLRI
jgi:hypothetical protein